MFGSHRFARDYDMVARDEQLAQLHQQLFLAKRSGQKHVIREIEAKIYRVGSSCYALNLNVIGRKTSRKKRK